MKKVCDKLDAVGIDPSTLEEIEKLLGQLSDNIEQSINKPDSHSDLASYLRLDEMRDAVVRAQSALEKLRSVANEIEQVKKELARYVR
jgi:type IV secretory pathway VirB4 component